MSSVPYYEGEFRYRIVGRRGEDIQIECDDFRMRMSIETFERGAANAAEVIAKHRLALLERGEVVRLPRSLRPV